MKLLTIDTSTRACSVAITDGERLMGEHLLDLEKTHSSRLLASAMGLLADAGMAISDLDGFGVSLGPGSFTGVRIGVATVIGLALATEKPVAGFSSLAMLAANLPAFPYPVCPMFDARKKEVYTAIYRCNPLPEAVAPDSVLNPASFAAQIGEPTVFIGDGAEAYRDIISSALGDMAIFVPGFCNIPRASAGALLALRCFQRGETIPPDRLLPTYLRASEAEVHKLEREAV